MIVGIGTDILDISRMERSLARHSKRFVNHIFTSEEQQLCPQKESSKATFYAGRWAAKEAVSKALGTGIGLNCAWQDIAIVRHENGKPQVILQGAGLKTANDMGIKVIHITISHEKNFAIAFAVAESANS